MDRLLDGLLRYPTTRLPFASRGFYTPTEAQDKFSVESKAKALVPKLILNVLCPQRSIA